MLAGSLADLADFKLFFDLPEEDPADDRFIERMLVLASELVETWCQRTFPHATSLTERHDGGAPFLYVQRPPMDPATSVVVTIDPDGEATVMEAGDYHVDHALGRLVPLRYPTTGWPMGSYVSGERRGIVDPVVRFPTRVIQISYAGGFPAIPAAVKTAVCIAANAWWYTRRNDPEAESTNMSGHTRTRRAGMGSLPDDALRLLEPYRIVQMAYVGHGR